MKLHSAREQSNLSLCLRTISTLHSLFEGLNIIQRLPRWMENNPDWKIYLVRNKLPQYDKIVLHIITSTNAQTISKLQGFKWSSDDFIDAILLPTNFKALLQLTINCRTGVSSKTLPQTKSNVVLTTHNLLLRLHFEKDMLSHCNYLGFSWTRNASSKVLFRYPEIPKSVYGCTHSFSNLFDSWSQVSCQSFMPEMNHHIYLCCHPIAV